MQNARSMLEPHIDHAQAFLQQTQKKTNENYVKPFQRQYVQYSQAAPLATTALTLFSLFSFVPLAVFVGFCALITLTLAGSATVFVAFWLFVILGSAAGILLSVLAFTGLMALLSTLTLAFGYLCYRLVFHVRTAPTVRDGVLTLGEEVKAYANATNSQSLNGHVKPE